MHRGCRHPCWQHPGFLSAAMGGAPVEALSYSVETLSVTRCDHLGPESWRVNFVNRLAR